MQETFEDSSAIEKILGFISARSRFYCFGHASPDGDSVGSCLAFALFLEKLGKKCEIVADRPQEFIRIRSKIGFCAAQSAALAPFHNHSDSIGAHFGHIPLVSAPDMDLIRRREAACVFLDCSGPARTGDVAVLFEGDAQAMSAIAENSIRIDHHPRSQASVAVAAECVDPACSSASELVARLVDRAIGLDDRRVCSALFFGIASDTGFFRFCQGSNSAGTFSLCARLAEGGALPDVTAAVIDGGKDEGYLEYYVALAKGAEILRGGKAALMRDDEELYGRLTNQRRPSDDLYRLFFKMSGIEAVVFVKISDKPGFTDGSVRVSALSDFDADAFCRKFGGGGHRKASGFHARGSLDDVFASVKAELIKSL